MRSGHDRVLRQQAARRHPARTAVRHAILVAVHGAAAAYVLFQLSRTGHGIPQAGLFVLAVSIAVVAVGLAVALAVSALDPDGDRGLTATRSCHSCGGPLTRLGPAWVCPPCDRLPLGAA